LAAPIYPDLRSQLRTLGVAELFDVHSSVAECRWALSRREPTLGPQMPTDRDDDPLPSLLGDPSSELSAPDQDLRMLVGSTSEVGLLRLAGPLSLHAASSVAAALTELLRARGRVVADLSAVRLMRAAALQVFPSTLAALGGWPSARLVLLDADRELTEALTALRIDRVVPLAFTWPDAHTLIAHRPPIVIRHHELPHHPGSPRRARALIRSACADWQIEALASDAALVATELVTNAVRHARTSTRLSVRIDDTALHIAVRDHQVPNDDTLQRLRSPSAAGHGLHIVTAISRARGVTPHNDGKTVWAAIGLDSAERLPAWYSGPGSAP
jgi:hypothetical protein